MYQLKMFQNSDLSQLASDLAAFYNRQGRIGNHVENAKLHVLENNNIAITVAVRGDVEDDGRVIDDIEERKSFLLFKSSDDTTLVNEFLKAHANEDLSRPYILPVGNELLYFISAYKRPTVDDDCWQDSKNDTPEPDDWVPA